MIWVKDHLMVFFEHYGVFALFVSITLETFGLPLPGESALIASSAAAGSGKFDIWHVVLAGFAGAVLGDNIAYLFGRRYGKAVILRYGSHLGLTNEKYEKVEAVTAKYGPLMVVGARFFVIVRQLNGLVAGATGMRWTTFIAANAVGAALWVGLYSTLAYQFGHDLSIIPFLWYHLSAIAMVLIPVLLIGIAVLYWRLRRRDGGGAPK